MKKENILIKVTDKTGKEYTKKIECNVLDTFNIKTQIVHKELTKIIKENNLKK